MNKSLVVSIVAIFILVVGGFLMIGSNKITKSPLEGEDVVTPRPDVLEENPAVNSPTPNTPTPSPITPQPAPSVSGGCFIGGCSSQICSDQEGMMSTCEYKEEYACYKTAKCERQTSGQCGWTQTAELAACLK